MRRTLQHILASALLVGGLAACDRSHSPTAPTEPTPERPYQITIVQQGPSALVVRYDSTWTEERARSVANQGLSDAMNLINMQTGTRGLVGIDANVYLQGELPGFKLDTEAPAGLYLPIGGPANGRDAIFCVNAKTIAPQECIAHQLQHRYSDVKNFHYAQGTQQECWPDVLHDDPRINTASIVAQTLKVTCDQTLDQNIIQYEMSMLDCDTDGTGK